MRGFFTVYLIIVLPLLTGNQTSGKSHTFKTSLAKRKGREVEVPTHLRIKRLCGIPDNVEWSYKTKVIYSKRILAVIDSLEN